MDSGIELNRLLTTVDSKRGQSNGISSAFRLLNKFGIFFGAELLYNDLASKSYLT